MNITTIVYKHKVWEILIHKCLFTVLWFTTIHYMYGLFTEMPFKGKKKVDRQSGQEGVA